MREAQKIKMNLLLMHGRSTTSKKFMIHFLKTTPRAVRFQVTGFCIIITCFCFVFSFRAVLVRRSNFQKRSATLLDHLPFISILHNSRVFNSRVMKVFIFQQKCNLRREQQLRWWVIFWKHWNANRKLTIHVCTFRQNASHRVTFFFPDLDFYRFALKHCRCHITV